MKPKQFRAIELILQGKPDTAIARELEVDRSTIARWRNSEEFRFELNQAREAMQEAFKERLFFLVQQSIRVCEDALKSGDTRVALALIKRFD